MSFTLARPSFILTVMVACLPFAGGGGCGSRTACFQFTQAEFDQMSSCPGPKDALAEFTDPRCPGAIVSVDGPGSFDGQICCYPVTYDDIVPDCGNSGTGAVGTGAFPGTTAGGGVTTVTTSCAATCAFAIQLNDGPPCASASALNAWMNLLSCACAPTSCSSSCTPLCQDVGGIDDTCTSCLQATCPDALTACMAN
jgi:hypothetical protein